MLLLNINLYPLNFHLHFEKLSDGIVTIMLLTEFFKEKCKFKHLMSFLKNLSHNEKVIVIKITL